MTDSSTQPVFLCTAVKLQCCHTLVHWTQHTQPSPSLIQHSFLKMALGLALGETWLLLVHPVSTFSYFRGQTCKNHLRRNQGCSLEKALSFSAQLTTQDVWICWNKWAVLKTSCDFVLVTWSFAKTFRHSFANTFFSWDEFYKNLFRELSRRTLPFDEGIATFN